MEIHLNGRISTSFDGVLHASVLVFLPACLSTSIASTAWADGDGAAKSTGNKVA